MVHGCSPHGECNDARRVGQDPESDAVDAGCFFVDGAGRGRPGRQGPDGHRYTQASNVRAMSRRPTLRARARSEECNAKRDGTDKEEKPGTRWCHEGARTVHKFGNSTRRQRGQCRAVLTHCRFAGFEVSGKRNAGRVGIRRGADPLIIAVAQTPSYACALGERSSRVTDPDASRPAGLRPTPLVRLARLPRS